MTHLTAADFVDLAEGTQPESAAPHLAACAACRARLAELRTTLAATRGVDVPEPSPLFWDHFSRRVHDAVAADTARSSSWLAPLTRSRFLWTRVSFEPLAALGLLALVAAIVVRMLVPAGRVEKDAASAHATPANGAVAADVFSDAPLDSDPSLALVASLASTLDADAAGQTAVLPVGSADHAVTHMSEPELRELERLLQDELTHSGD